MDEIAAWVYSLSSSQKLAIDFRSRARERGGIWDEVVNSYTRDDVAAVIREFDCVTIMDCFRAFQPLLRK